MKRPNAVLTHVCGHRHVYTATVVDYAQRVAAESLTCPVCASKEATPRTNAGYKETRQESLDGYTQRREQVLRILTNAAPSGTMESDPTN